MSRPTAESLLREMQEHMVILLLDPKPLARAPHYYLDYWAQLLARIQELLATPRPAHPDDCPYCGRQGNGEPCAPYCGATEE